MKHLAVTDDFYTSNDDFLIGFLRRHLTSFLGRSATHLC